jgi:hypothetical protein
MQSVFFEADDRQLGRLIPVEILEAHQYSLAGRVASDRAERGGAAA